MIVASGITRLRDRVTDLGSLCLDDHSTRMRSDQAALLTSGRLARNGRRYAKGRRVAAYAIAL